MVTVNLVNVYMVGLLNSSDALAAVGVAGESAMMPMFIVMGISVGTTVIIARYIGARDSEQVNSALRQSIILAFLIGLVCTVIVWVFAEPLMRFFRATDGVVTAGASYNRGYASTYALAMIVYVGNAALRGVGDTRTPMLIMWVINFVNVFFGWVFIFGNLGAPRMEVAGAGLAAGIARGVGGIVILLVLMRGRDLLKYDIRRAFHWEGGMVKRLLKVGIPAAIEQGQRRGAMMIYSIIIFNLGKTVQAAYAVGMKVESIAFMPGMGFGKAAEVLMGHGLGANRPDISKRAVKLAAFYAAIVMTIMGMTTFFFGDKFLALFSSDPEVIRLGHLYMKVFAVGMPLMGLGNAVSGGLRGAGDTRWVALLASVGGWVFRIPIGFIFSVWYGGGPVGAWSGAVVDWIVRGLLVIWRYRTDRWLHITV
jgi:putative MATE family efflux protein